MKKTIRPPGNLPRPDNRDFCDTKYRKNPQAQQAPQGLILKGPQNLLFRNPILGPAILIALFLLCTSCGSIPPPAEAEGPVPPAVADLGPPRDLPRVAEEEMFPEAAVSPAAEIPPEVVPAGPQVLEPPEYGDLPEPETDPAEAHWPAPVPPEEEGPETLPEPALLTLLPEPEPALPPDPEAEPPSEPVSPAPEPEPVLPPVPESGPTPISVPEPALPVPPPVPPPDPPPNLRPVEPPALPQPAREKPPVPVNPIPDLPPRVSQSVLQFPGETEGELTFSRVVRATVGQLVEIPFRGTGWVFLGELEARRGIAYGSRRLDPEGQSFIFRAEEAGAYALKFYKQDFIRDYILNDYVRVIIGEAPEPQGIAQFTPPIDRGRVIAEPRWPLPPEAASGPGGTPLSAGKPPAESSPPTEPAPTPVTIPGRGSAPISTPPPSAPVSAGTSPTPEQEPELTPAAGLSVPKQEPESSPAVGDASGPLPPEGYTNRAREEYDAGRIAPALSILDQFREIYPAGSDEAWWLYGQLLEANSPSRDIRSALDYYRRLVREYPQSPRIDEARRRIAYLERYYFNIH